MHAVIVSEVPVAGLTPPCTAAVADDAVRAADAAGEREPDQHDVPPPVGVRGRRPAGRGHAGQAVGAGGRHQPRLGRGAPPGPPHAGPRPRPPRRGQRRRSEPRTHARTHAHTHAHTHTHISLQYRAWVYTSVRICILENPSPFSLLR